MGKERPILFSGEMVRAILDGRKTQTRRVMKPQPEQFDSLDGEFGLRVKAVRSVVGVNDTTGALSEACPYGNPGDSLWVRETWNRCVCRLCDAAWPKKGPHGLSYQATYNGMGGVLFRPSIHMPRWACRIELEVVSVRVERLQDITVGGHMLKSDAVKEGCPKEFWGNDTAEVEWYAKLWDSINSDRGFGWDKNPWVWVIEFKKSERGAGEITQ